MAHVAMPLAGSVAETYLVETRGIPRPADWPDAIRFHAPTRSLLAIATVADGTVAAVQRVHLTADGQKAQGTPDAPTKMTNGRLDGAVVRLPARADGVPALASALLLAEGPENGLTVWAATGCETWLVFGVGVFQRVELPAGRRVILCRDDDREHSPADKALTKAVSAWRTAGADVAIATPWPARRRDKSDFADLIRDGGAAAVVARILPHAVKPETPRSARVPVAKARAQVDTAVGRFFEVAGSFAPESADVPPPVHGVRVGVGIGKSHAARHHAVALLSTLRARGDTRNVALLVPTHRLGLEQARMIEAFPLAQQADLRVAVWRGRAALDPDHPDYADDSVPEADKTRMCRNLDPVVEAQAHGLPVQESACRRTIKDAAGERVAHECPFFATCRYQAQRKRRADIWIGAHELLFSERPEAIGQLAAVVVDESAWQAGLEGVTGRGDRLPLDALRSADRRPGDTDRSADWLILQHHRSRALDAVSTMTDGPITRAAIEAQGLNQQDAAEARALEFKRLAHPQIHPGMTGAEREAALKAAAGNRAILQAARFWRAMEALLADGGPTASGWAELATEETQDGARKVVRLRGRKPVRKGWLAPTLLIDAMLDPELVRPFWPQLEVVADVQADTPHQRIRQVIDRAYSKSRLAPLDPDRAATDPEEARRRIRNLREARAIVVREARRHRAGRVLVVAQKGVREAIESLGRLPSNLTLAHHNSIAGRDEWGNVSGLVVIGRTAPPPADVERMAMALSGNAIAPIAGWYPKSPTSREMADGTAMTAEADQHPDPICEAIRWQVCEGELVQIIGRGRGTNRTATSPLDVLVMADAPLPLPIHEATGFADLAPTNAERMLAECGFAFDTPRHAAAACPALWPSWAAAKKTLEREGAAKSNWGTGPDKESSIGACPLVPHGLRRVDYQRAGRGQGMATTWFDPLVVADPVAALATLLGPLAVCEVARDTSAEVAAVPTMPQVHIPAAASAITAAPQPVLAPPLRSLPVFLFFRMPANSGPNTVNQDADVARLLDQVSGPLVKPTRMLGHPLLLAA